MASVFIVWLNAMFCVLLSLMTQIPKVNFILLKVALLFLKYF